MLKLRYIKNLYISLVFLMCVNTLYASPEVYGVDLNIMKTIREQFYIAVDNEDTTASLMNFIRQEFSNNCNVYPPVILAYYASLEGLRAKHALNPLKKLKFVKNAISKMEEAVKRQPNSLEIRFLRFSFYHQIPWIFGLHDKVKEDCIAVIKLLEKRDYSSVSRELQKYVILYMLEKNRVNKEQKTRLEKIYNEMNKE